MRDNRSSSQTLQKMRMSSLSMLGRNGAQFIWTLVAKCHRVVASATLKQERRSSLGALGLDISMCCSGEAKRRSAFIDWWPLHFWEILRAIGMRLRTTMEIQKNNRASNLRWATHAENQADIRKHGTGYYHGWRGESHPTAKLTDQQVIEIRRRCSDGSATRKAMAAAFGMSMASIDKIMQRKTWAHLS